LPDGLPDGLPFFGFFCSFQSFKSFQNTDNHTNKRNGYSFLVRFVFPKKSIGYSNGYSIGHSFLGFFGTLRTPQRHKITSKKPYKKPPNIPDGILGAK
jgi:hypothetical protein